MMMDNGAADVSGSTPLIPAPEEASDWSSSSLPPALPAHPSLGDFYLFFFFFEAALECQRPSVDAADEMRWPGLPGGISSGSTVWI